MELRRIDRRGQQMTLTTLILIVLGIAVLVFLIFGFSTGWKNLIEKIGIYGGGSSNIDDIRKSCEVACSSESSYAFCEQNRTMKYGESVAIGTESVTSVSGSCQDVVDGENEYPKINIAACPGLCN